MWNINSVVTENRSYAKSTRRPGSETEKRKSRQINP